MLYEFFSRVYGDVSRSGYKTGLSFDALLLMPEHVLHEIDRAVAGCFHTNLAAAKGQALAGQYTRKLVGNTLVLAEQVRDFASTDADVAGRDVRVGSDVPV